MMIWFYYGIHRLDRFIYLLAILYVLFSLGNALYMIPHLLGPFQNYVFTDKLKALIDKLIYMGIDMQ